MAGPIPAESGRIFISYRREETAYPAAWLYERLADRFGSGQVFKDVDSIELGDDFVEVITRAVGFCDVLLAVIGDGWLTITDEHGRRCLDDPNDFVRLEIEAALTRKVRVIPILVDGARMPRRDELPDSLAKLVRRQALELSPSRFEFDTSRLLKVLDMTLAEVRTAQEDAASKAAPSSAQYGGTNVTRIGGDVTGQVISGDNNLQYQIRVEAGGIVKLGPTVVPRRLPLPVVLRPRDFPWLRGRDSEAHAALAAIASGAPVEVQGQPKAGKTVLLQYLANRELPPSLPHGVVFLEVDGMPLADVLQSLFEAFHETDAAYKPTELRIRRAFQQTRALLLLDDATLDQPAITRLLNAVPHCVVVLTSLQRNFSVGGSAIALRGLPEEHAMAVVEQVLARRLTAAERPAAVEVCSGVDGSPGWLALAAAQVAQGASTFEALAEQLRSASPARAFAAVVAASLSAQQQQAVVLLAALNGPLAAAHLTTMTGIADVEGSMAPLVSRQIVTTHSPSYSLPGGLRPAVAEVGDLTRAREAALDYFIAHAEANRYRPDRLVGDLDVCIGLLEWAHEQERWVEMIRLGRAIDGALALSRRWGAWERALGRVGAAAHALRDRGTQAWVLHQLGTRALFLGEHRTAMPLLLRARDLRDSLGDAAGAAATRDNLRLLQPAASAAVAADAPAGARPSARVARPSAKVARLLWLVAILAIFGALFLVPIGRGTGPPTTGPQPVARSMVVAPERLAFGRVRIGHAVSANVKIRNTGTSQLVTNERFLGPAAADYKAKGIDCSRINPGEICRMEVTFTPKARGRRVATLEISELITGLAASTVALSGTGSGFVLTVKADDGATLVHSQPDGLSCPLRVCSASFAPGTLVTVTLSGGPLDPPPTWNGPCINVSPGEASRSCKVRMDTDKTVTYHRRRG
jgi:hypothetical protein